MRPISPRLSAHRRASRRLSGFGLVVLVATAPFLLAACGDDDESGSGSGSGSASEPASGIEGDGTDFEVREVPGEYPTIQEGVDAAEPGDLVLIDEGTYEEAVTVETENIVIRGLDRNKVILDGGFELENGFIVFSNGVAVENLTTRNYKGNGVFFTGDYDADRVLTGYRASYITSHNTGDYGLYSFNVTKGQFDHSYASGSPDAGYYVGQCNPCDTLITDVVGENNMLGYSGTNSTGVTIVNSEFMNNILGIVPNSQDGEELPPNAGTNIIGNYVHDNNNPEAPGNNDAFRVAIGTGIALAGTENNVVERNVITGNDRFGVILINWIHDVFGGETSYDVIDNVVRDNYIRGADEGASIALGIIDSSEGPQGNCFADNDVDTPSLPADLETIAPCEGEPGTGFDTIDQYIDRFPPGPEFIPYEDVPAPELNFENMPDAATAPPRPATDVPMEIDLDAIEMPEIPADTESGTTDTTGTDATATTAAGSESSDTTAG